MNNKELLNIYTKVEIDTDFSEYRVIRSEVTYYKGGIIAIDDILRDFREQVDQLTNVQIFIKGNRLFFSLENVKFYLTPTCWATEWQLIPQLVEQLRAIADNVCYLVGELD